jgi:glycosyltransferase involved in cell wall biosynthesis
MKVLHVSYSDIGGGAARAGYRLHQALRGSGVESSLLVRHKVSSDPAVRPIRIRGRGLTGYLVGHLQHGDPAFRSYNVVPSRWASLISGLAPDVVNLHWVGGETMSIEDIGRISRPVVFTLHDMWGFCGAEHYTDDRAGARWTTGYTKQNRPPGQGGIDLDRWVWQRKRRHWRPMHIVCPSRWLADCAKRSALMREWPIDVVPYALDLDVFRPIEKTVARRALELPETGRIILFGADTVGPDPRKGHNLFLAALAHLENPDGRISAVAFGRAELPDTIGSIPIRGVGDVRDDQVLARLYSAADVVVVPSRQDNLPQCATEAQACGTPVVAFRTAGLPDVVVEGETGYLVEPFVTESLAAAIRHALSDHESLRAMGAAARTRAVQLWAPGVIAARYTEIYRGLAAERGVRVAAPTTNG